MINRMLAASALLWTCACGDDAEPSQPSPAHDAAMHDATSDGLYGDSCRSDDDCLGYCYFDIDAECGAAGTGRCDAPSEFCNHSEYDLRCGCDGVTYANECRAAGSLVATAHLGECEGAGLKCRGDSECPQPRCECEEDAGDCTCPTFECVSGECELLYVFDGLSQDDSCGTEPDAPPCEDGLYCQVIGDCDSKLGICVRSETTCEGEYLDSPACGCDSVTYPNECELQAAEVGLARLGACDPE